MGKRSNFERVERDFYPTPLSAVLPLLPHLPEDYTIIEPCAGDCRLVFHLEQHSGLVDWWAGDIDPRHDLVNQQDVFSLSKEFAVEGGFDYIITNPPWDRKILHPLITHLSDMLPTWLLFDADWMHTKQSVQFLPRLRKVVSVGRVKWIEDSKSTGKDNCCWYLFDKPSDNNIIEFYGRF